MDVVKSTVKDGVLVPWSSGTENVWKDNTPLFTACSRNTTACTWSRTCPPNSTARN